MIVLVAILFLALVFMVALVVNTGQLFVQRRALQNAADEAAVAGAYSKWFGNTSTDAIAAACDAASLNGYTDTTCARGTGTTVKANYYASYKTFTDAIEVIITTNVEASLVPQWGLTTISARGVAATGVGDTSQGLFALGKSGNRNLQVGNRGTLTMCAVYSPHPTASPKPGVCPPLPAATTYQGTTITNVPGGKAHVSSSAGPCPNGAVYNQSGTSGVGPTGPPPIGASVTTPGAVCGQWPNPASAPVGGDPYSGQAGPDAYGAPSVGALDKTNWCRKRDWSAGNECRKYTTVSGTTLTPGVYEGVSLSGNSAFMLEPGVYVFTGRANGASGGISIGGTGTLNVDQDPNPLGRCWSGAVSPTCASPAQQVPAACGNQVAGSPACGVLLFFTYNNWSSASPSGQCATLTTSSGSGLTIAPEADGPWAGWLIWYNEGPGNYCDGSVLTLGGNANLNLQRASGLIYAPGGTLQFAGNNTSAQLSQLVAKQITVSQGDLYIDIGTAANLPKPQPRLIE